LIKPNVLGPFDPDSGIVTHPKVVGALVKILKQKGLTVVVGEASVVGTDTMTAFKKAGYFEIAQKYGIKLVDFNKEKRRKVKFNNRILKIPEIVFSHEYINIPKLKTHDQAFVSISMKNQKGLLMSNDKKAFHRKGIYVLGQNVLLLSSIVQPDLNIVDGIDSLEGNGPGQWGIKKNMDILVAGCDMFEVDNVCVDIMGFDIDRIEYIPKTDYSTVGLGIKEVRSNFIEPEFNRARKKLNCCFWLGEACSGCNQNIRASVTGLWKRPFRACSFLFQSIFSRMNIVAGNCENINFDSADSVICIGECTRKEAERKGYKFIPGCPPDVKTIIKNL
ncbi:MAG: DUF362 domain-containing protein, partial [Thermodesulfobacteriota bacterium]|nr:DUF362 domain-containing protein [Thermodesulfobacteriota bacterium]